MQNLSVINTARGTKESCIISITYIVYNIKHNIQLVLAIQIFGHVDIQTRY